jgi:hypothetical protein
VELADAYRVLEIAPGASKDEAKEARTVLAKVWHPDRHQGDPKLHDRADRKLREINEAYSTLEAAKFPATPPPPPREAPPAYVDAMLPRGTPTPPRVQVIRDEPPRRKIRWWVPVAVGALVIAGIVVVVMHDKHAPVTIETSAPTTLAPPKPIAGFTIGSSRDDVKKIMGAPTRVDEQFGERWSYGMAEVTFRHGVVYGWRSSAFDKLKVTLAPTDAKLAADAKARGNYGPHAGRDEVLGVEGAPDGIDDTFGETWTFGMSHLTFDQDGHIKEVWDTYSNPLHLKR